MGTLNLETKFCTMETIKMAYNEYGSGPDILLIHPNSSSKSIWDGMRQTLFKEYHSIAIDLRCHGETVSDQDQLTYSMSGQDVLDFTHKMKLTNCPVVGYSDGAIVILYMASIEPSNLRPMVAVSPNLTGDSVKPGWIRMMKIMIGMSKVLNKLSLVNEGVVKRSEMMLHNEYLKVETLASIRDNVLVIHGDNDICIPEHFVEMKAFMPRVQFIEIEKASHGNILKNKMTHKQIINFIK